MGKKIRNMMFESNSSSMHTICITENNKYIKPGELVYNPSSDDDPDEFIYIHNGKVKLWDIDGGYGRSPFKILYSFEDKLKYAMCEYLGNLHEDDPEWEKYYCLFVDITKELLPDFTEFEIRTRDVDIYLDINGNPILHKNLIYDGWKNNMPVYKYKDEEGNLHPAVLDEETYLEEPCIGQIDHQSSGMLKKFLADKGIDLREFLTNKKYIIVIDGDEYCYFEKYIKQGFINKDFITEIYDKSGEDIEYIEWLKEMEKKDD